MTGVHVPTRSPFPARVRPTTLRRAAEFRAVIDGGLRLSGRRMVLYVVPCEQGIRVGFVCGRSVGGAVARNRARRQLKEGWRELAPRLRGGRDVVIVARPEISGAAMAELLAEMEHLLLQGAVIT